MISNMRKPLPAYKSFQPFLLWLGLLGFLPAKIFAEPERFFFDSGSWGKYIQEPPEILVADIPMEIDEVLSQGERILVNLFDADRLDPDKMVAERFEPQLEELGNATPDVVSAEGYSTRHRRVGSYTNSDYATVGGYYSYDYETVKKERSTSKALIRDVRFAVRNIDLESIDQKVEILRMAHRKWTDRTSGMPGTGTSKLIREANFTYLSKLKDYIGEWVRLQNEVEDYRKTVLESQMDRVETLEQWSNFEANEMKALDHLKALDHFFEENTEVSVSSKDGKFYDLPSQHRTKDLVLSCMVSDRQLYFRLNPRESTLHPFNLIPVGSVSGETDNAADSDPFVEKSQP